LHARSAPFLPRNRVDYALGVATTTTLLRHIDTLKNTVARLAAAGAPDKLQRFKEFYDGAASWDRAKRISLASANGKFESESRRLRKNGSRFWATVVLHAIGDEEGQLLGFAKVMRTASCNCGCIRTEARGEPVRVGLCHCTTCRKESGAPFTANAILRATLARHRRSRKTRGIWAHIKVQSIGKMRFSTWFSPAPGQSGVRSRPPN
jgi:hypothetical protein